MRIVQKYGGTSVGDIEKIRNIAKHLKSLKEQGKELVVVVSAMGKSTDALLKMAYELDEKPCRRELDRLMSTGEQQTIALLTMALHAQGVEAISLTGLQAGITTTGLYTKSKIKKIDANRVEKNLDDGKIVIVAGFQGYNEDGDVTTLGRGGSDTSAVALAAALGCPCEIYTDVDGIYSVDPRVYTKARKLDCISYEEMMEMSNLGAGVMEVRAVELGKKYGVPIYVGRSLGKVKGTYIKERDEKMEDRVITGLSINENTLMAGIRNIPNNPQDVALIFEELGKHHVNVDMISQSLLGKEVLDLSFTCPRTEEDLFDNAVVTIREQLPNINVSKRDNLIKVSLVGIGMMSHSGVAATVFSIFSKENIKFYQVTTSEISISYTIDAENKEKAVTALGKEFSL